MVLIAACSGSPTPGNANGGAGSGANGGGTIGNPVLGTGGNADGVGAPCSSSQDGQTRSCCGTGSQTCGGTVEFKMWGPCLNPQGQQVTCSVPNDPGGCGKGEFGPLCPDGGSPTVPNSPGGCGKGEFGPQCADGGVPPLPSLCTDESINNEPEILVGYEPGTGQTVGKNGQIKVWVNDERPEIIAPMEQVDNATGAITMAGDRTAKAADGYLWEPALYIAPLTAESGGPAHFPQFIKGWYNNVPPANGGARGGSRLPVMGVQTMAAGDPVPASAQLSEKYTTEVIWDVASLGLAPGTYIAEFVIHDGDRDRGVGCVTITITN